MELMTSFLQVRMSMVMMVIFIQARISMAMMMIFLQARISHPRVVKLFMEYFCLFNMQVSQNL